MTDPKLPPPANHLQQTSIVPPTRPPAVAPTPRRSAHHRRPFSADPVLGAPFLVRVHAGTFPNRKIGDVGASHDTTREARHERTSASAPAFDFGPLWWEGRSLPPSQKASAFPPRRRGMRKREFARGVWGCAQPPVSSDRMAGPSQTARPRPGAPRRARGDDARGFLPQPRPWSGHGCPFCISFFQIFSYFQKSTWPWVGQPFG